jgi:uncharacterized membrane protein YqgA involved in biofilm formation
MGMSGTLVNFSTIILAGLAGTKLGHKFNDKIQNIIFKILGTLICYIGWGVLDWKVNYFLVIFSLLLGTLVGKALRIEDRIRSLNNVSVLAPDIGNAFITASLIFCVGPMAILGALNEGLRGDPSLLYTKALLDGVAAFTLSTVMGRGVVLSSLTVLIYQGLLTFLSIKIEVFLNELIISNLSFVGGVIIISMGLNILKISNFKIGNFLPCIVFVIVGAMLF